MGNGLVARAFQPLLEQHNNLLLFASGVSNSSETDESEYRREELLLETCIRQFHDKKLIYFSTISVMDPFMQNNPYMKFKLKIEAKINASVRDFLLIRAPNLVGHGGNPNTLLNYFMNPDNPKLVLWKNTERNFLSVHDFARLALQYVKACSQKDNIYIVHPCSYTPVEILETIEQFTGKKLNFEVLNIGTKYIPRPDSVLLNYISTLDIVVENYLDYLLNRYYPKNCKPA